MLISEIKSLNKGKVKVCFIDGTDLTLYRKEANEYGFAEGMDADDHLILEIETKVLFPRAKKRAMNLLEQKDYTEKQMRDKLSENGYGTAAIEDAIRYVKDHRYLDDRRYAGTFIRMHCEDRSRMRIKTDLRSRGICEEIIDCALEEEYITDESQLIAELILKKGFDITSENPKEKARIYRYLTSKGFSANCIMSALHHFGDEIID